LFFLFDVLVMFHQYMQSHWYQFYLVHSRFLFLKTRSNIRIFSRDSLLHHLHEIIFVVQNDQESPMYNRFLSTFLDWNISVKRREKPDIVFHLISPVNGPSLAW
jgi:hypothetical protein